MTNMLHSFEPLLKNSPRRDVRTSTVKDICLKVFLLMLLLHKCLISVSAIEIRDWKERQSSHLWNDNYTNHTNHLETTRGYPQYHVEAKKLFEYSINSPHISINDRHLAEHLSFLNYSKSKAVRSENGGVDFRNKGKSITTNIRDNSYNLRSSLKNFNYTPKNKVSRSSRDVLKKSGVHIPPVAMPVAESAKMSREDSNNTKTTDSPVKSTTPSIESLMPSKIIPSLPPHLRQLTTTTPLPAIFFNNSFISNVTAQLGQSVFLPCRTRHSSDRKFIPRVSWVRRRDWHILTSGTVTYTTEQRYDVHHPEGSTEWTLVIKYVKQDDAGTYECQLMGGDGLVSHLVHLDVVVPQANIPGNGEYHIDTGSTISLMCYIEQSPIAPRFIFWYHNSRMINYDRERGGIVVDIESKPEILSRLTIQNAKPSDSGNYTCDADNTQPDSITVYITEGNKIAAIQPRDVDSAISIGASGYLLVAMTGIQFILCKVFTAPTRKDYFSNSPNALLGET